MLEFHGLDLVLKNEFASGAIGEVSAFDAWVEVWVRHDSDYDEACKILESSLSKEGEVEWVCKHCKEKTMRPLRPAGAAKVRAHRTTNKFVSGWTTFSMTELQTAHIRVLVLLHCGCIGKDK